MPDIVRCVSCGKETYSRMQKCPHCGDEEYNSPHQSNDIGVRAETANIEELVPSLTEIEKNQVLGFISYLKEGAPPVIVSSDETADREIEPVSDVVVDYRGRAVPRLQLAATNEAQDYKECPKCAETIRAKAIVCRFCRYNFDTDNFERQ